MIRCAVMLLRWQHDVACRQGQSASLDGALLKQPGRHRHRGTPPSRGFAVKRQVITCASTLLLARWHSFPIDCNVPIFPGT